ncbi:MAG: L,D-transpeptidase catalytic domain [Segetibacter sp.]|nr:L,D-transpeptidase catalytic domain [Segetibacter sp.]
MTTPAANDKPGSTENDPSLSTVDAPPATDETNVLSAVAPEPVVVVSKIKAIEVRFSKAIKDINKRIIPYGTATATYSNGTTLSVEVTGGCNVKPYGITDPVKNLAIFRVENSKYKNHNSDAMPYALFYHGGEALHVGRIDKTSHGCIHVADVAKMKKLNQDSVENKTAVSVIYNAGVLDKVMKQHL